MENYKILLIGDSGSGKTSLLTRYIKGTFTPDVGGGTIGVDYESKQIKNGNTYIRLQLWDTAGQERFRTITSVYYRNVTCAIIIFDLNKDGGGDELDFWLKEISQYSPEAYLVIVGNKTDLPRRHNVNIDALMNQYSNIKAYIETSASQNKGVTELFNKVVEIIERDHQLVDIEISTPKQSSIRLIATTTTNTNKTNKTEDSCMC